MRRFLRRACMTIAMTALPVAAYAADDTGAGTGPLGEGWISFGLLAGWLLLSAFVFAKVEIQIEGAEGWAANLPTWRIEKNPLVDRIMGGRPLTGYHFWMFSFMFIVFHLPMIVVSGAGWKMECRIVGSLLWFWILEDFLWFVLNPAFGLTRFRKGHIPWHTHWIGPVPADYISYSIAAAVLVGLSFT